MNIFEALEVGGKPVTRIRRPTQGKPDALDGYVDATMMCKAAGKMWGHYFENQKTKNYISALEKSTTGPVAPFIVSKQGGPNDNRGTWVHPLVALDLAAWCSPTLARIEACKPGHRGCAER